MNGKISSFLRKVATEFGQSERSVKKMWNDTPRNKRGGVHQRLKKELVVTK